MKIYTKTGDQGETGLMGGKRVTKDSLRITAIGEVDECNALLGICQTYPKGDFLEKILKSKWTNGASISRNPGMKNERTV